MAAVSGFPTEAEGAAAISVPTAAAEGAAAVSELPAKADDIDAAVIEQLAAAQAFIRTYVEESGISTAGSTAQQDEAYYDSNSELTYHTSSAQDAIPEQPRRTDAVTEEALPRIQRVGTVTEEALSRIQRVGTVMETSLSQSQSGSAQMTESSSRDKSTDAAAAAPDVQAADVVTERTKEPETGSLRSLARMGAPEDAAGRTGTDVIRQLASTQEISLRTNAADETTGENVTGQDPSIVQYYDSDTSLVYYILPDGTRVEADQAAQHGKPMPDRDTDTARIGSRMHTDTDVITRLASITAEGRAWDTPQDAGEADILSDGRMWDHHTDEPRTAGVYYDSKTDLKYLLMPEKTRSEARQVTPLTDGAIASVPGTESLVHPTQKEKTVVRSIMHYLRMAPEMRTVIQKLLTSQGIRNMPDVPADRRDHRVLQKHFYIRQTRELRRLLAGTDTDTGRGFLREGSVNDRGETTLLDRIGAEAAARSEWRDVPDLTYEIELVDTQNINYTRQGRLVDRIATESVPAGDRSQSRQRRVRLVQRRQTAAEAADKEEISRLAKRLREVEEKQEIEESEYENAARVVRQLKEELITQKESVERLTRENRRLLTDLKTQEEQEASEKRLEELFDNSGQLDRQRYGMTQLF